MIGTKKNPIRDTKESDQEQKESDQRKTLLNQKIESGWVKRIRLVKQESDWGKKESDW